MPQRILARALNLYWAFVPATKLITHETFDTWEWKFCVQLAMAVEHFNEAAG